MQPNQPLDQTSTAQPVPQTIQPIQNIHKRPTTAGVVTIVFGILQLLIGVLSLSDNALFGCIIIVVAVYWIVMGQRLLKGPIEKYKATITNIAASALGYTGILFFLGLFMPGFRLSAVVMPLVFTIIMTVLSKKSA